MLIITIIFGTLVLKNLGQKWPAYEADILDVQIFIELVKERTIPDGSYGVPEVLQEDGPEARQILPALLRAAPHKAPRGHARRVSDQKQKLTLDNWARVSFHILVSAI